MSISLIVTGGEAPSEAPRFEYDQIIAADSGYDTAILLSLHPDKVVGDFDSTHLKKRIEASGFVPLPRDKDWSDTEVAIKALEGKKYDILGGGGGRFDHLMAILALFEHYPLPRFWFMKSDIIIAVESCISLKLDMDTTVSVMALPGKESRVRSEGLVWPLEGHVLSPGFMSLSNRNSSERVYLEGDRPFLVRIPPEYLPRLESVIL